MSPFSRSKRVANHVVLMLQVIVVRVLFTNPLCMYVLIASGIIEAYVLNDFNLQKGIFKER